jgi:hypothetical protein
MSLFIGMLITAVGVHANERSTCPSLPNERMSLDFHLFDPSESASPQRHDCCYDCASSFVHLPYANQKIVGQPLPFAQRQLAANYNRGCIRNVLVIRVIFQNVRP